VSPERGGRAQEEPLISCHTSRASRKQRRLRHGEEGEKKCSTALLGEFFSTMRWKLSKKNEKEGRRSDFPPISTTQRGRYQCLGGREKKSSSQLPKASERGKENVRVKLVSAFPRQRGDMQEEGKEKEKSDAPVT